MTREYKPHERGESMLMRAIYVTFVTYPKKYTCQVFILLLLIKRQSEHYGEGQFFAKKDEQIRFISIHNQIISEQRRQTNTNRRRNPRKKL
jgi:hypothetical protein